MNVNLNENKLLVFIFNDKDLVDGRKIIMISAFKLCILYFSFKYF